MEGSIDPDLSFDIQHPRGSDLEREAFRTRITCFEPGYDMFSAAIHLLENCLQNRAAVVRVTADLVARAAEQGVAIFEPTFAPGEFRNARPSGRLQPYTEAILEGIECGCRGREIRVVPRMLVVSRHLTDSFRSTYGDIRSHVDEYRKHIVGVDLCGLDRMTPEFRATFGRHSVQWDFRWLRDFCSHVRSVGLRLTAHAGEFSSPEPIRWAVNLGAERIGHGIQAAGHLDLEAALIERSITLEVCPLSNYRTGAVALGAAHPLKRLLKAGVPVTINTDDPSVQNSDWRGEYEFAKSHLGLSEADISRCIQNAVRASFCSQASSAMSRE